MSIIAVSEKIVGSRVRNRVRAVAATASNGSRMVHFFSRFFLPPLISASFSVCSVSWAADTSASSYESQIVPGELLLKFKTDVKPLSKALLEKKTKIKKKSRFDQLGFEHWVLESPADTNQVISDLASDPSIDFVEPNFRRYPRIVTYPNESVNSAGQKYIDLQKPVLLQAGVPDLWGTDIGSLPKQVNIAIIDDGFNYTHADLQGNVDAGSYDFVDNDSDPSPDVCVDPATGQRVNEDHGTEVAGVIGARTNNNIGVAGVAWNARLFLFRIGCLYSVAAEAAAIERAIAKNVQIINASYGGVFYSEAERTTILKLKEKGILFVSAAGNAHLNNDWVLDYPGALDLPNILSVAASDAQNRLADWSQYGATNVDIAAPGVGLYTINTSNDYSTVIGTSFSAAMVSGISALLIKRVDTSPINYRDLKAAMIATATPMTGNIAHLASGGQVNGSEALKKLLNPVPVVVIKSVKFDDSVKGDGDNEVDVGEVGSLDVVVENIWQDAQDLKFTLSSRALSAPITQDLSMLSGDATATIKFDITSPFLTTDTYKKAQFELKVVGIDIKSTPFTYTRAFEYELGHIRKGKPIASFIKKLSDDQDEVQRYHFNVPAGLKEFAIDLVVNGSFNTPLYLMVRRETSPQFEFFEGQNKDSVQSDPHTDIAFAQPLTGSTSSSDYFARIKLDNPKSGKYYAVVTAGNTSKRDIEYHLEFSSKPRPRSTGCSVGTGNAFDPSLMILTVVAWVGLRFRSSVKTR